MSSDLIEKLWYRRHRPLWPLLPLSWLYRSVAESKRRRAQAEQPGRLALPVVVVGNITAGGTGKSPLTARLVQLMTAHGWRPVILSRGYGGKSESYPLQVTDTTPAGVCGDEPLMLARATGCPVVVDPDRLRGARHAIDNQLGDVLICDDGLQHYRLPRDIELAVFDGRRGVGNGALIPVGPLREPVQRLSEVDFVVVNGGPAAVEPNGVASYAGVPHPQVHTMALKPSALVNLNSGERQPPEALYDRGVRAVAGIGNPSRFFDTLRGLGARVTEKPFPDHHHFRPEDLGFHRGEWLVMTAKDAVKCRGIAPDNAWMLTVEASLPKVFEQRFLERLADCAGRPANAPSDDQTQRHDHG